MLAPIDPTAVTNPGISRAFNLGPTIQGMVRDIQLFAIDVSYGFPANVVLSNSVTQAF